MVVIRLSRAELKNAHFIKSLRPIAVVRVTVAIQRVGF